MQLERLTPFTGEQGGIPLKWPNSAAIFKDGRIAIADGGNNRIIILSPDGEILCNHGEQGFKPENLREPIFVAISPDQYLFVSDWHNHRVLVFAPDLKFSHTLFHLGAPHGGFFKTFELFIKHLLTDSVGAPYYFSYDKMKNQKNEKAKYSFKLLIKGLFYYIKNLNQLKEPFSSRTLAVRKVNGIAFDSNQITITQKANRCISTYRTTGPNYTAPELIQHIETYPDNTPFGRLCNLSKAQDGGYYACDQNNWWIIKLNKKHAIEEILKFEQQDATPMGPFSCAEIAPNILVIARSFGIEIRDLKANKTLWHTDDLGETHGITWDETRQILYYVDRSNSQLERFKVTF